MVLVKEINQNNWIIDYFWFHVIDELSQIVISMRIFSEIFIISFKPEIILTASSSPKP